MELVYSWLKEYVDVDLPIVDLAHALTMTMAAPMAKRAGMSIARASAVK